MKKIRSRLPTLGYTVWSLLSPAFKLGFEAIDTSKIGLLRDRCRCQIQPAKP